MNSTCGKTRTTDASSHQGTSSAGKRSVWLRQIVGWAWPCCLWGGLGFSLGWYYVFTYYGATGIPIPTPETVGGLILYYFSVLNCDTEIQAVHWMLVFPLAGLLWVGCLRVAAKSSLNDTPFRRVATQFAWTSWPLCLAGPPLAWLAGQTQSGFSVQRMIDVALRRGFVTPGPWLTPLFLALGVLTLFGQVMAYRKAFSLRGLTAFKHVLIACIGLVLTASIVGLLVSIPLRLIFE